MISFDKNDTYAKIVAMVADKLSINKNLIKPTSTYQELGADSLDMVDMVMRLEDMFGIEINDEDAEKLTTIAKTVDYVHPLRTK